MISLTGIEQSGSAADFSINERQKALWILESQRNVI